MCRINRIRLEFKEYQASDIPVIKSVLIESDWNLKEPTSSGMRSGGKVLIESDWNLKSTVADSTDPDSFGINRIRLEFKDDSGHRNPEQSIVLIESDWNLKMTDTLWKHSTERVLIESDWNLKELCGIRRKSGKLVLIESDWNLKLFI